MVDAPRFRIGVIGGTGMYEVQEGSNHEGGGQSRTIGGKEVAFLPRHGIGHYLPPHMILYKQNIEKLAGMGVERIISTTAVGSLRADYKPGDFVITDQFINMTHGRDDTFFHEKVVHVSTAFPYCEEMRGIAVDSARKLGYDFHERGTVVVVNGPRFSTNAESKVFRGMGADTINMTQYPEVALAKEKAMCYLNISIVTDYDSGVEGKKEGPVSYEEVEKTFKRSLDKLEILLSEIIKKTDDRRKCGCSGSLDSAVKV